MTDHSGSVWYYLIGAGFIGFWLYMATVGDAPAGWLLWGVFGIAIAAAFYAGRLADDNVRIGIWIVTGLFGGFLVAAAILEPDPMFVSTFITGVGAGLIAAGLPSPNDPTPRRSDPAPGAAAPQPPAYERAAPQYGPPADQAPQWQRPQQQQQQWSYGQEYR